MGLDHIKTTTHALENVFRALCGPNATLTPAIESLIFEGYGCLQLLLSAQIADAHIDEASIVDRMADVVSKLEKHLGKRFGQDGYLPTSNELGVDITQSVFEKGVTKRLQELENALKKPDPATLTNLLRAHADVFSGLAESFNLPGFGSIVQTTLKALDCRPELVVQIAEIALTDYRAGQRLVLEGDRTQGGEPSLMLQKLATSPKSSKNNWLGQVWNVLNQPIPGTAPQARKPLTSAPNPATTNEGARGKVFDDLFTTAPADSLDAVADGPLLSDFPKQKVSSLSVTSPSVTTSPGVSNLKVSVDHLEQINYAIGDLLTQQNRQALYNSQLTTTIKA